MTIWTRREWLGGIESLAIGSAIERENVRVNRTIYGWHVRSYLEVEGRVTRLWGGVTLCDSPTRAATVARHTAQYRKA